MNLLRRWWVRDTRSRRVLVALALYLVSGTVFAAVAGPSRLSEHTLYNHYALLADAWLHGRQDLPAGAPHYTGNNDFASFEGKTFISFPPFPSVLMLPLVKLAGSPENFRDGQFMIWLAGLGPALLFLVLEKLPQDGEVLAKRGRERPPVGALRVRHRLLLHRRRGDGLVRRARRRRRPGRRVPPHRARRRASAARGSAARVLLRHAAGDEHARGALCARGLPGERRGGDRARDDVVRARRRYVGEGRQARARPQVRDVRSADPRHPGNLRLVQPRALPHLEPAGLRPRVPERRVARSHAEVGALRLPLSLEEPRLPAHDPSVASGAHDAHEPVVEHGPAPFRSTSMVWRSGSPRRSTCGSSALASAAGSTTSRSSRSWGRS